MRGGRMLMVIGVLVLVGAAVIGGIMVVTNMLQPGPDIPPVVEDGTPGAYVPPPPEDMVRVVVAAQPVIPQGTRITEDAVTLADRAKSAVPEGALTTLGEAVGRIAREDIAQDTPITEDMITDLPSLAGSDASLLIPSGKVAYAMAVAGNSSVAWAIEPGDHVDVLISIELVDLDEEFQTSLPNEFGCIDPPEGGEQGGCRPGRFGRIEVLPNGWVVNMVPGEDQQHPRMATQVTVQDALVLRLGTWPGGGISMAATEPPSDEEPVEEVSDASRRMLMRWLTLAVTPQDALVLKYVEEVGASIDFVLRSAQDRNKGTVTTEVVTLQYVLDRFAMEVPPTLPYGVTMPPAVGVRLGAAGEIEAEVAMEVAEYSRWHHVTRTQLPEEQH